MEHTNFKRSEERPLIWAHRGASGYAPENTLPSFAKAIELGADGVELDVQLTKDGEIVVIHDETIDRTSDGSGWVKDKTLAELRKYNYNATHPEYAYAGIPTLRAVYEFLKPAGLTINVELKTGIIPYPGLVEKVMELTKEMGMEEMVLYSSFNHSTCVRIHEIDPQAYVGFLYADGIIDIAGYTARYGGNALHPALYFLAEPGYMERAKAAGLDVNAWTINEPEHIGMAKELGINAIITNYPDRALEIVNKEK